MAVVVVVMVVVVVVSGVVVVVMVVVVVVDAVDGPRATTPPGLVRGNCTTRKSGSTQIQRAGSGA